MRWHLFCQLHHLQSTSKLETTTYLRSDESHLWPDSFVFSCSNNIIKLKLGASCCGTLLPWLQKCAPSVCMSNIHILVLSVLHDHLQIFYSVSCKRSPYHGTTTAMLCSTGYCVLKKEQFHCTLQHHAVLSGLRPVGQILLSSGSSL